MRDGSISVGFAAGAFLWIVGATLVVIDLFLPTDDIGHLGIVACCGGAVVMIRSMMCRAVGHLEGRFNHAFDLGRDVGRAEREVPLQRVH